MIKLTSLDLSTRSVGFYDHLKKDYFLFCILFSSELVIFLVSFLVLGIFILVDNFLPGGIFDNLLLKFERCFEMYSNFV